MDLNSNRLDRPYTDGEIRVRLEKTYGLDVSRRTISFCRKEMGIPPFHRRVYENRYPPTLTQFSPRFPVTSSSVKKNAPEMPGVYELSLDNGGIEYPYKSTGVFYIGSSMNIKKRLQAHLGNYSKNGDLNGLINKGGCLFQFCSLKYGFREKERMLLQCFKEVYGSRPKGNKVG